MKLLTAILFLTSFSALSQTIGEGVVTKTSSVDVKCKEQHFSGTKYKYINVKTKSEVAFWGEGKIRLKLSFFGVYKNDYSFSYIGIDNGFGEFTLYEKPSDIKKNNPVPLSLQLFPETAFFEVRNGMRINKEAIVSSKLGMHNLIPSTDDWEVHCRLAPNTDISFEIKKSKDSQRD